MNRSLITGIVLGAAVAAAAGAIGGYRLLAPAEPTFAEVLEAKEVTEEIPVSREVCKDVQVTHRKAPRDEHQILGTVAGAVIGGLYGQLSKASRVHRADAKTLAGLSAGFLVALLYLTLSHLLKDLPIGFVVGIMCPLTGFLYVLFVPTFIRFHDDLLPASLDGAMVGAGVAVFLAYVFFVMTNSIDNGPLGSATPLIANLDELLPQAVLGGALGAGVIGLLSGLLLTNWQDL